MKNYNMPGRLKESYQNIATYASFMGDKVKDILNHKITAKDGLVALVAGAQLMNLGCALDSKTQAESQPTYEVSRPLDGQEISQSVREYASFLQESRSPNRPVLVRLTRDMPYFLETSPDGDHVRNFSNRIGIKPLSSERLSDYDVIFSGADSDYIQNWATKLDKNKDKIIKINEQH
tara:strand:+ start:1530 stop:2060 length:531 start_codon:yes stop_codon:yes gene_type:complete